MVRMGEVILMRQRDKDKKIMRRKRDKDKCTDYHDKDNQGNQGKEKAIETSIGEVISMR